jgi:hypothetical protein
MTDSQTCSMIQIKVNSAKGALDRAKKTYEERDSEFRRSCMSTAEQGQAALTTVQADFDRANAEAQQLTYMHQFLLGQLKQESDGQQTLFDLGQMVLSEAGKVQEEIDHLKGQIRTERRRFLDADPSAPTAVAGMYFTKEPDNQVLIAFLACFGAFLLFASLLVIQNVIPIMFFRNMSSADRLKFVGTMWAIALIVGYIGFYMFT